MMKKALYEYVLDSTEAAYEDTCSRRKWDSWPQEDNFMMEIIITGMIRNILHFPAQLT